MNDAERSRMVEHPRVSRVVGGGVAAAIAVPFVVAAIRLSRMHPNAVLDIAQTLNERPATGP